ncbi:hypothetical protein FN846DRAFT_895372 [Sphaerosporella brunnea]|uniref:Uncharacterized protein n=1 Tax=Sphaerosporella brunnea TaxID=1250544 RepID=A0A5J5EGA9_9PEZI|nr:hypothetical protein FN846DRAFT_895372 [Sphaerosporella brunnea]
MPHTKPRPKLSHDNRQARKAARRLKILKMKEAQHWKDEQHRAKTELAQAYAEGPKELTKANIRFFKREAKAEARRLRCIALEKQRLLGIKWARERQEKERSDYEAWKAIYHKGNEEEKRKKKGGEQEDEEEEEEEDEEIDPRFYLHPNYY